MAGAFDSAAFEELKRQVEAWGLDDKQKGKFLMEEWRKMREAEEKKAEREAEREIERLRIELETKRLEATSREREQRTVASGMRISSRSPELPPFADGHDDLDNYLLRFERYAGVAGWEKQIWATQLSALLSGRALEVYSRLSQEDAMEYDVLKVALLKRYSFTEEGYRQRFREAKPANHESPSQFIVRLRNFFNKWVELSNSEATYEGVVSLMIYEQFINSCPKELAIHLKERKPKTVEEMAEWAEQYLFAHGRSFSWGDSRQKRETARSETKRTSGQSDRVRCYRCQGFGHRAEHCSYKDLDTKGNRGSEERDRKRCYRCGKTGHIARDCRIPQKLEESGRPVSSHKVGCAVKVSTGSEEETGEEVGVLELKSGEKIKVLNGACVNAELKDKMPVVTGRVEGKTVEVLRDTGCSGVIVRRDLVKEEEITNRTGYMLTVDRTVRRAPVGMVNIDTPYYTGRVEALCLQDPLFDLIVGNIEGARAPEDPDVKWDVAAAVVTRSQARKDIVDPPLKVKEITFDGVVTKERLGSMQREDESLRKYGDMKDILVRGDFEVTYEWHKGILYRTRRRKDGDGEYVRQVMTPNALRKRVMELAHDSVFSGHLGTRRTEERIQASFYWPGMHKDITSFCRSCDICQKTVAKRREFKVGDKVLVLLPTSSNKLLIHWRGPYTITKQVAGNNYKINTKNKFKTYHANMLKPYFARSESSAKDDNPEDNMPVVTATATIEEEEPSVEEECLLTFEQLAQSESVEDVKIGQGLTQLQKEGIRNVLQKYNEVFSDLPGRTDIIQHRIKLTEKEPVRSRAYPLPYAVRETLKGEISEMLKLGIIQESDSPYASPIVLVKKKDGSNRLCVDYRKLNRITETDPEPMDTIEYLFQRMNKSQYFSKIDLSKGYWQIPVAEEDVRKTAFVTPDGQYEFRRMPFGMKNSGATLVRGMRKILAGMNNVASYIDDLIVYTDDWESHVAVVDQLLERLHAANLTARPTKCLIGTTTLDFLGHQIGHNWVTVNEENLEKIRIAPRPTTKKEVRSFFGLANYYREYIPSFATIAAPLSDLIRKGQPNKVIWGEAQEKAFTTLQEYLLRKPILRTPDHAKTFVLRTDASNHGLGAALLQEHDGKLHPIAYASKQMSSAEKKYSTLEKECLAIVWGVNKFRLFLMGKRFTLQTDHQPLAYLGKAKFQNDRVMRWALTLQGYDYYVEDIPGKNNVAADYLSRIIV